MSKPIIKTLVLALAAAALVGMPAPLLAQSTNRTATAAGKKSAPEKKQASEKQKAAPEKNQTAAKAKSAHPFHGKLVSVDKAASTIVLGKSTYYITPDTKMTKDGKPATLDDAVAGEPVGGYAKPGEGDKMVAASVRFGPKPEAGAAAEKKKTAKK